MLRPSLSGFLTLLIGMRGPPHEILHWGKGSEKQHTQAILHPFIKAFTDAFSLAQHQHQRQYHNTSTRHAPTSSLSPSLDPSATKQRANSTVFFAPRPDYVHTVHTMTSPISTNLPIASSSRLTVPTTSQARRPSATDDTEGYESDSSAPSFDRDPLNESFESSTSTPSSSAASSSRRTSTTSTSSASTPSSHLQQARHVLNLSQPHSHSASPTVPAPRARPASGARLRPLSSTTARPLATKRSYGLPDITKGDLGAGKMSKQVIVPKGKAGGCFVLNLTSAEFKAPV